MNIAEDIKDEINSFKFHSFSSYGNISDYSWLAFYEYFSEVVKIDLKNDAFYEFKSPTNSRALYYP